MGYFDQFSDSGPSEYGWIITRDYLSEQFGEESEVGVIGPSDFPRSIENELRNGGGRRFRMFDDDGELYYEGRVIGELSDGGDPLTDFGMPNAGCTRYDEFENGKWVTVIA